MEYENIRFPKVNIIRIETSDSIGCIIDSDPSIKLNVKRKEAGWIVTGYDNHEIDQGDILRFDSIYKEESKVLAVKDSIEEIIRNFVEGVSQMRQSQDTDLLKANCTEACYKYLLKRAEYDRIRGNKPRRSTLKKMERAQVFEDSADCRINIKGMGWGRINLLFKEGTWLVAGENGDFWTDQDAKDIEEDITTYKELIKFNDRIELFNERFKTFFETGDSSPLHEIATEKLIEQLEIYRRLAGTVDTSYLQIYGMSPSYSPESYYAIYGDSAYYNEIYDSIRWIKQNGQWVFDELFCNIHIEDKFDKAHQTFYDFRKLMTISYSIYNTSDNIYTTPPVPVTPLHQVRRKF
jgi:hypothetical protein